MTQRLPLRLWAALVLMLLIASAGGAATLTITPDKSVYQVGEEVTLSIFGDSAGAFTNIVHGPLLFDPALASFVSAEQDALTSLGGLVTWTLLPLEDDVGLATAFFQIFSINTSDVDGPLTASVVLRADAPGVLEFAWRTTGNPDFALSFFGLTTAPGGSVMIVPEPSTLLLLALGLPLLGRFRASRFPCSECRPGSEGEGR